MKKIFYFLTCLVLFLSACSSYEIEEKASISFTQGSQIATLKFKYKGIIYLSNYQITQEKILYENKTVEKIINHLQTLPELATYIHTDGLEEYFDTYNLLCQSKMLGKEFKQTRANGIGMAIAKLTVYTRAGYKGDKLQFIIDKAHPSLVMNNLATCNMDDKITSFKLNGETRDNIVGAMNCSISFFENINLGGRSITWQITYPNIDLGVKEFENINLNKPPLQFETANNKISSFLFAFK